MGRPFFRPPKTIILYWQVQNEYLGTGFCPRNCVFFHVQRMFLFNPVNIRT